MSDIKNPLPSAFTPPHVLSGLDKSESILVGFSGGADSTALLHMLSEYAKDSGAKIYAAHVNHGIRGEEADRDESFCQSFAKNLGVEFFSLKIDIPRIAKDTSESVETAARKARYEYFDRIMQENNIKLLATAHNADDNLETVIFNIARGTGLSGICGIPSIRPCKNGIVIRPILGMEKSEIVAYCRDHGLDFVTDSTNTDTDYTRNRIRAEIIPVMRQINSNAVKNAARMSELLREDSGCLDTMAEQFIKESCEACSIEIGAMRSCPAPIVNRAIMSIYGRISGERALEQVHVNALRELAQNAVAHSVTSLPGNIEGVIEGGRLCFRQKNTSVAQSPEYEIELVDGKNFISHTNSEIFIGTSHCFENIYKKSILMSIDSAKIKGRLVARQRRSGDKIRMGGMSKSVKKLMCDKKIPLELRSQIPIICDGDGILAIPFVGIRDGAKYKGESLDSPLVTNIKFSLN